MGLSSGEQDAVKYDHVSFCQQRESLAMQPGSGEEAAPSPDPGIAQQKAMLA